MKKMNRARRGRARGESTMNSSPGKEAEEDNHEAAGAVQLCSW